VRLSYRGEPLAAAARLPVALNSYRAAGGGGFPFDREGRILWSSETSVRDAVADHIRERGEISPGSYHRRNWELLPAEVFGCDPSPSPAVPADEAGP
jgi:2',3'-cyclic-nucleotide 2'-phosphodiesterase/3'-nucleotidase